METSILNRVVTIPCHPQNRGGTRTSGEIRYLVYHYTGNDGDAGANNARYYRDRVVRASAHYFVDDDTVTRSVGDLEVAWAVGGKRWSDCPKTGGGRLYGTVTNRNSLSIELCDTRRDGSLMATEATLALGAELGRALMEKYHIPIERVVRHFDVTGKHCPAYFMEKGIWENFKKRLTRKEGEEEMKLYQNVTQMPNWARPSAEKAIRNGYIGTDKNGTIGVWESNLQTLVWMDRAGLLERPAQKEG